MKLPFLTADSQGRTPRTFAEAAPHLNSMVWADDLILIATSADDANYMLHSLHASVTAKGLTVRDEKLEVWTNHLRSRLSGMGPKLHPGVKM